MRANPFVIAAGLAFVLAWVDAVVAATAAELRADVVSGDRADIRRLLDAAEASGQIIDL